MKILITGPVGSGKTTQSQALARYLGICFIDTGNILRELARFETSDGRRIKSKIDHGLMAPDDIVGRVVREKMEGKDCQNGFVMDGYPRTVKQLGQFDPKYDGVFYLEIDDEAVSKRLMQRGRIDDTHKIVQRRLKLYHDLTEPILEYYQSLGILHRINANRGVEPIQSDIRKVIDEGFN